MADIESEDSEAVRAYTKFGTALRDIEAHRQTLCEQTSKSLIDPLKEFVDGTLGEIKETKKVGCFVCGNAVSVGARAEIKGTNRLLAGVRGFSLCA